MKNYERPVMIRTEELAEGVYLASGGIKCDSVYMNGVWQAPDYSDWNGTTRGYKQQFGVLDARRILLPLRAVEPLCGFRVCGKLRCG